MSAATVTNRVRKKADFCHRVRVLGGGPHTPTKLFWRGGGGIVLQNNALVFLAMKRTPNPTMRR